MKTCLFLWMDKIAKFLFFRFILIMSNSGQFQGEVNINALRIEDSLQG